MQTIEQHPYVDQVLSPLPTGEGVGEHLVDDPALEFLEDEIRKVGSLAHNDIDWSRVERESLAILSGRSKDLKVLGFLMLALQRQGDGERFALSLYLLRGALGSWWSRAWPQPGERGARARRLLFNQMLQRAHKPAEGLSFNARLGDGRGFCLELVADLIAQVGEQGLPDEPLLDLRRLLERLPAVDETPPAPVAAPEPAETAGLARGAAPASLGELVLDPGNERATRQSLLRVAELLTGTEPANPLLPAAAVRHLARHCQRATQPRRPADGSGGGQRRPGGGLPRGPGAGGGSVAVAAHRTKPVRQPFLAGWPLAECPGGLRPGA